MDWFMVSAGAHHTCGLRQPGTLFCWGDNSVGQLGSDRTRSRTPSQIVSFADWTDVRCGGDNCCARRNGGQLFCWGGNQDGSVGSGQAGKVPSPTQISPDNGFLPGFSVGIGHACAIWSDRELACWGRNAEGQLGIGRSRPNQRNPAQVQPGMNIEWSSVAVGQEHTCGVRLDGRLSCWGGNIDAELGVVLDEPDGVASKTDLPVLVDTNNDWVAIAAGAFYTCGIRRSQDLFCWGRGSLGQLGLGVKERVELPARVGTNDWIRVGLGVTHSCGIDVHRQVYCWGDNTAGQLGTGDTQQRAEPMRVPL
jgi:alpha-tubulin suppressor-like RCC1 family protein